MNEANRKISEERQILYYAGMVFIGIGFLIFFPRSSPAFRFCPAQAIRPFLTIFNNISTSNTAKWVNW